MVAGPGKKAIATAAKRRSRSWSTVQDYWPSVLRIPKRSSSTP